MSSVRPMIHSGSRMRSRRRIDRVSRQVPVSDVRPAGCGAGVATRTGSGLGTWAGGNAGGRHGDGVVPLSSSS